MSRSILHCSTDLCTVPDRPLCAVAQTKTPLSLPPGTIASAESFEADTKQLSVYSKQKICCTCKSVKTNGKANLLWPYSPVLCFQSFRSSFFSSEEKVQVAEVFVPSDTIFGRPCKTISLKFCVFINLDDSLLRECCLLFFLSEKGCTLWGLHLIPLTFDLPWCTWRMAMLRTCITTGHLTVLKRTYPMHWPVSDFSYPNYKGFSIFTFLTAQVYVFFPFLTFLHLYKIIQLNYYFKSNMISLMSDLVSFLKGVFLCFMPNRHLTPYFYPAKK